MIVDHISGSWIGIERQRLIPRREKIFVSDLDADAEIDVEAPFHRG